MTHTFDHSHHYLPLQFTLTGNGLDVQMPANAGLAPPGDYLLFIVNGQGVPSIGQIVNVSYPAQDLQPPTTPANLTATGSPGKVRLAWAASTDNVSVVRYNVYRSTTSGFTLSPANLIAQPVSNAYLDSAVGVGTYYYVVTAEDFSSNVSAPSNQASATVASAGGLVAAYSFSEGAGASAADRSGNGYTASLFGGTTWPAGTTGTGLGFNGTTAYATVASLPSLPTWTVSAWVKSPAAPTGSAPTGPVHRQANLQICWNHPSPSFQGAAVVNVAGNWYSAKFGPLAANTWYYLTATYDGETLSAYTNGVLISANPGPSGPASNDPNPLTLGRAASDPQFFQGSSTTSASTTAPSRPPRSRPT